MPSNDIKLKFEEAYKKYFNKIFNYAFYLSLNRSIAEDLCADCFTNTYEVLKNDVNKIQNMQAWLFKTLKNSWINYRIKNEKQINNELILLNIVNSEKPDEAELLDTEIEFNKIIKLIDKQLKPDIYKEVMILKYKFELEYDEIASILNITIDNARQINKRALDKLKKLL